MTPERDAIEQQLEAIFASEAFAAAPKMRSLLRYLVDATLAGDADRLKGYAIGVDVFERGAAFDAATDPIVRVQAGRLRKLLDAYYLTSGQADPVRIEIPKGGYAVTLTARDEAAAAGADAARDAGDPVAAAGGRGAAPAEPDAPPPAAADAERTSVFRRWTQVLRGGKAVTWTDAIGPRAVVPVGLLALGLAALFAVLYVAQTRAPEPPAAPAPDEAITLAVLPFTNMSKDETHIHFAHGLSDALTTALARVKSISVASRTSAFQYREATDLRQVGRDLGVGYIVEGGLQHDGERMRLNVQLIDATTGAHVWAQDYDRMAGDEFAIQSELVRTLAAEIRPQLYGAAKRAMKDRPPQSATAWQLYMQATWMPGEAHNSLAWEKERVAIAQRALTLAPKLGQAHSVLADKLAFLANVDPPSDTPDAVAASADHARRAVELAAGDADVMFNVSIHHWHAGRIQESVDATQRTLELDPNHVLARFLVKAVPYTCSEAPQGVIDALIAFDAAISPDNPVRWVTLHWISMLYLNNGDIARAAEFARRSDQVFRTPNTSYHLAAILVQLGETGSAIAHLDQQRTNWPNLDARHYADVSVPRRCGTASKAATLKRLYDALADAVETAARGR